jgi:hypothetical protein
MFATMKASTTSRDNSGSSSARSTIQDHAPQFVFGLEYLWHYAPMSKPRTTRAEAGYGLS